MRFDKLLLKKGTCCVTGKPLKDCRHINLVSIPYKATWKHPTIGNILLGIWQMAIACVHDDCLVNGIVDGEIKYAIEFFGDEIIYHPLSELEAIQRPEGRTCRECGCSDTDACYHPDHGNCYWVEQDLCSHCKLYPGESTRYSQMAADKPLVVDRAGQLQEKGPEPHNSMENG